MTSWEADSEVISDHHVVTLTKESDHGGIREYVGRWGKAIDHNRKVTVATVRHVRRVAGVGLMLGAIVQQYSFDCVVDRLEISR